MIYTIKTLKFWGRSVMPPTRVGSRRVPSRHHIPHACLDSTAHIRIRRSAPWLFLRGRPAIATILRVMVWVRDRVRVRVFDGSFRVRHGVVGRLGFSS